MSTSTRRLQIRLSWTGRQRRAGILSQSEDVHSPADIGNPQERTAEEIALRIIKLTGSASAIEYAPLPEDDPKVRRPDISRGRNLLGWEPRIGLDEWNIRC